jgi:uncharacterized protein with GYD domain
MPKYLIQAAYTPEAWATLTKKPQNRIEAVRPAIEQAGGKVEASYLCFGEYDLIALVDLPDNVAATALAIDFSAGGALKAIRTTPLMTWDEGIAAMKKAGQIDYRPAS